MPRQIPIPVVIDAILRGVEESHNTTRNGQADLGFERRQNI